MEALATTIKQAITEELYKRYIDYLDAKPKTIETYRKSLKQFFQFLSFQGIEEPTRADVIAFRQALQEAGRKPATIAGYLQAVKLFFAWTDAEGIYPDIAKHVKAPKVEKNDKKDYLTSSRAKALLASIDRTSPAGLRDYAIIALMMTCGLRDCEAARADICDIGTIGDSVVLFLQGKGRDDRAEYVKLPAQVEDAIRAYLLTRGSLGEKDPLFTSLSNNSQGKRLSTRSISGIVKARLTHAGFTGDRFTAHSLRHTAVNLALLAGKGITEVQQFARHKNIATTMVYVHCLDRAKNSCSAAISAAIF